MKAVRHSYLIFQMLMCFTLCAAPPAPKGDSADCTEGAAAIVGKHATPPEAPPLDRWSTTLKDYQNQPTDQNFEIFEREIRTDVRRWCFRKMGNHATADDL